MLKRQRLTPVGAAGPGAAKQEPRRRRKRGGRGRTRDVAGPAAAWSTGDAPSPDDVAVFVRECGARRRAKSAEPPDGAPRSRPIPGSKSRPRAKRPRFDVDAVAMRYEGCVTPRHAPGRDADTCAVRGVGDDSDHAIHPLCVASDGGGDGGGGVDCAVRPPPVTSSRDDSIVQRPPVVSGVGVGVGGGGDSVAVCGGGDSGKSDGGKDAIAGAVDAAVRPRIPARRRSKARADGRSAAREQSAAREVPAWLCGTSLEGRHAGRDIGETESHRAAADDNAAAVAEYTSDDEYRDGLRAAAVNERAVGVLRHRLLWAIAAVSVSIATAPPAAGRVAVPLAYVDTPYERDVLLELRGSTGGSLALTFRVCEDAGRRVACAYSCTVHPAYAAYFVESAMETLADYTAELGSVRLP